MSLQTGKKSPQEIEVRAGQRVGGKVAQVTRATGDLALKSRAILERMRLNVLSTPIVVRHV